MSRKAAHAALKINILGDRMARLRVYELARDLNMTNKVLHCQTQ